MPVPRHFQMGVIPVENWILVNFLYRFNMLLAESEGGVGYLIFTSKGPGNRDLCKRPWGKDIFATSFHGRIW